MKLIAAALLSMTLLAEPPLATTGTVNVNGASLFYEKAGQGPAVVLIHDGLLHCEVYDELFPFLARKYAVLRYDRRGYGRSTAPVNRFDPVEDLVAVMQQAGMEKAWLVGMSAGGGLAVDFALAHPERVQGLVLLGAVVSGMSYTEHFLNRGGHFDIRRTPYGSKDFVRYFTMEDPYEVAPGNTAAKQRARQLLEANPQNVGPQGPQRLHPETVGRLGTLRVPTTILVGEHDIPDVHAAAGMLHAGIPGSRRKVIAGSGHLLPLEQPRVVNQEILRAILEGTLFQDLQAGAAAGPLKAYRAARAQDPGLPVPEEGRVNDLAYQKLQAGLAADAVELFRFNVESHPDSWNAHDSLGEGLLAAGDRKQAEVHYRRSLELNPGNDGAKQVLESLKAGAPAALAPPPVPQDPRAAFAYDASRPLEATVVSSRDLSEGVVLQDLHFASPVAGRITAYRVAPKTPTPGRKPAGILFMHWGQGDRSEFLAEAAVYARDGAVCLLLDAPWGRPQPWRQIGEDPSQPDRTRAMYVQTVVDLRRAVDLLLADGVDPARIGYVGHSFGATWGGPLAGAEPRLRTSVLMGGLPDVSDLQQGGTPKLDAYVASIKARVPAPLLEAFARAVRPISGASLVGLASPSSVFFQFGTVDSFIPRARAEAYASAAREPKRVAWYDCSHEFNDPRAARDRAEWLGRELGLEARPRP